MAKKSKMKKKAAERPPSTVVKGLQQAVAFRCFVMLQNPEDSGVSDINEDKQELVVFKMFHGGNEGDEQNYVSQIDQLLQGRGDYACLFDVDESLPEGQNLVLKEEIHRQSGKVYIANVSFDRKLLCAATMKCKDLVNGRTILRMGRTSLGFLKKAYAMVDTAPFASWVVCEVGEGKKEVKFTSGHYEHPDLDEHILDEIFHWKDNNGAPSASPDDGGNGGIGGGEAWVSADGPGESDSSESDDEEVKDRKPNWIFTGWFAWKLFGPCAPESNRINFGQVGEKANQGGGRANARKKKAQDKMVARDAGAGAGGRGLSINTKKDITVMAMQEDAAEQRKLESEILATQSLIASKTSRLKVMTDTVELLIKLEKHERALEIMTKRDNLQDDIEAEEKKLEALRDKKRERPAEYDAFMSQVESVFGVRSGKKPKGNDAHAGPAATEDATTVTNESGNDDVGDDDDDDE